MSQTDPFRRQLPFGSSLMKAWKSYAYFNGTRENQPNPMSSNARLVIYFLLSILVVVNAGMTHDGEEMAMETSSHQAPTSFKAGDSPSSIDHAKFTMNAGSSGTAPGLMTIAKADTKVSVPHERTYVELLHQDLRHHSPEGYDTWETAEVLGELRRIVHSDNLLRAAAEAEELRRIVNRDNFSSNMIEDQSAIKSITEEAVGWLRARPYEGAYQVFEELFVSSPNIAIGQLLDEKDQVCLVKLGHKTAQWIKPREMKPGTTTTTETFDSIGELLHHVFESSLVATKDTRVPAEVLDASLLWKLNDIHLQSFIDRCLADKSIFPEKSLGIFDPERKLFLVKLDHKTVQWVHPRSRKQTFIFIEHLLALWHPLIVSSWISLEDLTLYLNRLTALLIELSINKKPWNTMPIAMIWQINGWIYHYEGRLNKSKQDGRELASQLVSLQEVARRLRKLINYY